MNIAEIHRNLGSELTQVGAESGQKISSHVSSLGLVESHIDIMSFFVPGFFSLDHSYILGKKLVLSRFSVNHCFFPGFSAINHCHLLSMKLTGRPYISDGASYMASGALPHHSLAFDFGIIHNYFTFSFTTFSES